MSAADREADENSLFTGEMLSLDHKNGKSIENHVVIRS